ncbi:mitogen-activated protein kinase kinase kinase 14 isoform X1 [Latimeria chalumnae]|uniref:mitogen-activated protein kinase kinase kinase 14 isoform X1 n=1 Tax=Latimeria chalumnae TaxID=7897 RepID=UPI0003C13DB8|nr:PREDICTED: mitogen-activated protein kinase kinase kinase 14 [Latimeria chalumnae]|eukprot:XP_005994658.1 PREDICTED: mitogen-activated protein kinase kinase kinase 14 [Latimeria chalumnae]
MAVLGSENQGTMSPATGHHKQLSVSKMGLDFPGAEQIPDSKKKEEEESSDILHSCSAQLKSELCKVISKGTAQPGSEESMDRKIFIITQAQCEDKQELCPSHSGSIDYSSRSDSSEHILNNVAKESEGRVASLCNKKRRQSSCKKKYRRNKSKCKRKKSSSKEVSTIAEQESSLPVPVQEDDYHHRTFCSNDSNDLLDACIKTKRPYYLKEPYDSSVSSTQMLNDLKIYPTSKHLGEFVPQPEATCPYNYENDPILYQFLIPDNPLYLENFRDERCCIHAETNQLPYLPRIDAHFVRENRVPLLLNLSLVDSSCRNNSSFGKNDSKDLSMEKMEIEALQGNVTTEDKRHINSFTKVWKKASQQLKEGFPVPKENEGILLHEKLKHKDYEYKENINYSRISCLGHGTFGEVYEVKDNSTGFQCAAKTLPLENFRAEELLTLTQVKSPRIVPLLGAVREGLNITLFMEMIKGGSLGQLIKEWGSLPEDRALYYHGQVLEALEHLHAMNVLHGDVKADNVLLSTDGKQAFLCDFGHSAQLSATGIDVLATGDYMPGTRTHMAPEVVKGTACDVKVDVWSSCCMMLHILNGCHPWREHNANQIFMQIANEPPPVDEIPASCSPYTTDVIRSGLEKESVRRASASELRMKVIKALKEVGGLTNQLKKTQKSSPVSDNSSIGLGSSQTPVSETGTGAIRELESPLIGVDMKKSITLHKKKSEIMTPQNKHMEYSLPLPLSSVVPSISKHRSREQKKTTSDWEIEELEREFFLNSLSQPYSPEFQEQMLSCLRTDSPIIWDYTEKDSLKGFPSLRDDLSSGIHSWNSQTDGQSLSGNSRLYLSKYANTSNYFNGVDVLVQSLDGECLNIRECRRTRVGQVAVGLSAQISSSYFSLVTMDGQPVSHEMEIPDSGINLKCTLAPDCNSEWTWRIRDGKMEKRP